MVLIIASVPVARPAGAVWRRLTDWPQHGRWIPFTRVGLLTPHPDGVGARFVGRTALGPVGFDDPMEVVRWQPPAGDEAGDEAGVCDVVKQGRLLAGRARFEVLPVGPARSVVTMTEDVELALLLRTGPLLRLVRLADPLVAALMRPGLTRVLRAMARDVESG